MIAGHWTLTVLDFHSLYSVQAFVSGTADGASYECGALTIGVDVVLDLYHVSVTMFYRAVP